MLLNRRAINPPVCLLLPIMNLSIPSTMRAAQILNYDGSPDSIQVVEKPVPQPGPNQVLVQMARVPINPSDLMFLKGLYGVKKELPVAPGWEGSGRVVASGGGWMGKFLVGKRVACAARNTGDGTWAEYLMTDATRCVPLSDALNDEQGAMLIVNPLTAWALMDIAARSGSPAFVQTAAASALGRMILRLSLKRGVPGIHVVRRDEQAALLKSLGATHVLNSVDPDFDQQLRALCGQLKAKIGFEAVAGEMTGRVLNAMPAGSQLLVYGALSESGCLTDPRDLIFEGKRLEGFFLASWLGGRSILQQLRLGRQVQSMLGADLKSEIQARFPLTQAREALIHYQNHMTDGKVLLMMGDTSQDP